MSTPDTSHQIPSDPTPAPASTAALAARGVNGPLSRLGERMRRAREARNLSFANLSDLLGGDVTRQHLALIEAGRRDPSFTLVARIAVALDLDVVAVVWGQKQAKSRKAA